MIDWTQPMAQTFEFCEVDPDTWQDARRLLEVKGGELSFDEGEDTGGHATFKTSEPLGETYVRTYLVAEQEGRPRVRVPLGTFLAQTSSKSHDGASAEYSVEAYTPLLELADGLPPVGFSVAAGTDAVAEVADLAELNARAPAVRGSVSIELDEAHVAEPDESWLEFLNSLAAKAGTRLFPDEMGQSILIASEVPAAMRPVRRFTDDEASIVQAGVTDETDLYGVPNHVEVVYSADAGAHVGAAVNDNPDSPTSTAARGRVLPFRETSPDVPDGLSGAALDAWLAAEAARLLGEKGAVTRTCKYTRGYVPDVRVGSCVRLDLERAGVHADAVVTAQSYDCSTGCQVTETVKWQEVSA